MVYPTLRQQSQRHKKDENITKIPLFFLYFAHQFLVRAFSLKLHCCSWWWGKPNKDKVYGGGEAPLSDCRGRGSWVKRKLETHLSAILQSPVLVLFWSFCGQSFVSSSSRLLFLPLRPLLPPPPAMKRRKRSRAKCPGTKMLSQSTRYWRTRGKTRGKHSHLGNRVSSTNWNLLDGK